MLLLSLESGNRTLKIVNFDAITTVFAPTACRVGSAGSRKITEAKQQLARSVLGWETTLAGRVLLGHIMYRWDTCM